MQALFQRGPAFFSLDPRTVVKKLQLVVERCEMLLKEAKFVVTKCSSLFGSKDEKLLANREILEGHGEHCQAVLPSSHLEAALAAVAKQLPGLEYVCSAHP